MLTKIKGKLIVSVQALEGEPLFGSNLMAKMALAVYQGGAAAIRANGVDDIAAIAAIVPLPIIGIVKKNYGDCPVFITPTMKEVDELMSAKATPNMIAIDATNRDRPDEVKLEDFVVEIRKKYPNLLLMADTSTVEEGMYAAKIGFDCISTTLYGYTKETQGHKIYDNDFEFLKEFINKVHVPIIAEGNIITPEHLKKVMELGVYSAVVGGAITRPKQITERFISIIS